MKIEIERAKKEIMSVFKAFCITNQNGEITGAIVYDVYDLIKHTYLLNGLHFEVLGISTHLTKRGTFFKVTLILKHNEKK